LEHRILVVVEQCMIEIVVELVVALVVALVVELVVELVEHFVGVVVVVWKQMECNQVEQDGIKDEDDHLS